MAAGPHLRNEGNMKRGGGGVVRSTGIGGIFFRCADLFAKTPARNENGAGPVQSRAAPMFAKMS